MSSTSLKRKRQEEKKTFQQTQNSTKSKIQKHIHKNYKLEKTKAHTKITNVKIQKHIHKNYKREKN